MNEPRDPLEKVSNSLRRAVNVNKTRESDLRNKVSTLQRERRESMNTWSLKQEKFLKAKLKMMPAIRFDERRRNDDNFPTRRVTLTRAVKPMDSEEKANTPKEAQSRKSSTGPSNLRSFSKYPNPLPPVFSSSVTTDEQPHGFYMQQAGKLEKLSTSDHLLSTMPRTRRVSDYRPSVHEYLYGNREEEQREAIRHKLSVHELQKSATLARKVSCYKTHKMGEITEENTKENANNNEESMSTQDRWLIPSIANVLPKDHEQGNKKARERWRKIRESLSTIVNRQKKKDISKMSLYELTTLFEGIRECRYLRVGSHTSYRGDSIESTHCRCIACTVKDRNKLKNNLSASD